MEMAEIRLTGCKDRNGEDIAVGDTVSFSYGIPPVRVDAPVVHDEGQFWAVTEGHTPSRCLLAELAGYVDGVGISTYAHAEWRERYINRIIERAQCDRDFAADTYAAGIEDHDYSDNPEAAADEELSYWTD